MCDLVLTAKVGLLTSRRLGQSSRGPPERFALETISTCSSSLRKTTIRGMLSISGVSRCNGSRVRMKDHRHQWFRLHAYFRTSCDAGIALDGEEAHSDCTGIGRVVAWLKSCVGLVGGSSQPCTRTVTS